MKSRTQVEIENLKQELRNRERERKFEPVIGLFAEYCWIFLPLIGFIMLIVTIIRRMNKSSRLERECNELREKIRELERQAWEEERK